MASLSTDRILRYVLHELTRRLYALGLGALTWAQLSARGWPWWAWLPAVILAMMVGYLLGILVAYAYQKSTYQIHARLVKDELRRSQKHTTPTPLSPSAAITANPSSEVDHSESPPTDEP